MAPIRSAMPSIMVTPPLRRRLPYADDGSFGYLLRLHGKDDRQDELTLCRGVLDVIANRTTVGAKVHIDVRLDLPGSLRLHRPELDVEAVRGLIVGKPHR